MKFRKKVLCGGAIEKMRYNNLMKFFKRYSLMEELDYKEAPKDRISY